MLNITWGLKPVLFYIGAIPVESYGVFMVLALIVGFLIYYRQLQKDQVKSSNALYIVIFALIGGVIGSKIPILIIYWKEINAAPGSANILLSGRTIVGGLIGGAVGTFGAKKLFKIKERMGNQIAIPVAAGMAVGRIGCTLRGCCYGKPTSLPWGIDFGDQIYRHPTQIYEILFDVFLVLYLSWKKKGEVAPGELFKIFLNFYMSFRFFLEFIRVEKVSFIGLTAFQLLCVISLVYINRNAIILHLKRKGVKEV
jgi:phosphatidylglycerol:prolipoprotein diacylglycerol transferase